MIRPAAIPERLGHIPQAALTHEDLFDTSSIHNVIVGVDEQLYKLHRYGLAYQSSRNQMPNYSQEIAELRDVLNNALQTHFNKKKASFPWPQYYALLNRDVFIEELTYAPLILGATNMPEHQLQQFADGVYGLNVHLLADALSHYDTMDTYDPNRNNLRGIINELTSVALLNRDQTPGHLALPAHYMADAYRKTDTIYYHRVGNIPYATNIQVKSYLQAEQTTEHLIPPHGILIDATDMSNLDNFATSRAIVAELYQEPQHVRGMNHTFLERVHSTFIDCVHQKIIANNARYETYETTALGMVA
jgi:hypothetical protein